MKDILTICKKNNIFTPSCSIYGGLPGVFDYGPIGAEIKLHLRKAWWQDIVYSEFNVHGIETALLTPPALHEYSGFMGANYAEFGVFETTIRNDEGEPHPCHLRVTTAQHSFANFDNIVSTYRPSLPFGIAQIGKAFRHELDTTSYPVRMREFEQMELQYFVQKKDADFWHEFWLHERLDWWQKQGINPDNLIVDDVAADELAHYSSKTYDINYKLDDGTFFEIEGVANRGDFDCGSHSGFQEKLSIDSTVAENKSSKALMAIGNPQAAHLTAPYVIEPAAGVDRGLMAILLECFTINRSSNGSERVVLGIRPHLAPVKACLYIRSATDTISVLEAKKIKQQLQKTTKGKIEIQIGAEMHSTFRHHDEIGTPIIIIMDDQRSSKKLVQIRDRDSAVIRQISMSHLYHEAIISYAY
ncbi:His/Gly/Thr/Pro-type tRNA ligase C-terminal domain-containing protein [Pseudomonas syringae]|nr:His/Gly/Thr/Pro-type tRNA ligase C-terminal domain-containing protein [Pseudomonas syringae]